MHMKMNVPTGMGLDYLEMFLRSFRRVGIVCAPILKPKYEEFANRMDREFQIKMRVYTRTEYVGCQVEEDLANDDRYEVFVIDDTPESMGGQTMGHPRIPLYVHMQEFFFDKKILMVVM